mmetsp:Transcript_18770/g.34887  ORF Transcript_18770/g.34887 Transcript_18770/m.34887 type:complete len:80 (-) Transcript_18770:404-643(-)
MKVVLYDHAKNMLKQHMCDRKLFANIMSICNNEVVNQVNFSTRSRSKNSKYRRGLAMSHACLHFLCKQHDYSPSEPGTV